MAGVADHHGLDWTNAAKDEGGGVGWGNLNYQGGGLFRNTLPWEEGVGANYGDASNQVHSIGYGFLEEGKISGEDGDRGPIYERGV